MTFKDFIFSYRTIVLFYFNKKKYFRALKKITGYPYKFFLEKIRVYFKLNKINLDNYKNKDILKNANLDEILTHFNSDKASTVIWSENKINGHNYSKLYEKYFHKFRNKEKVKLLEIGSLAGSSAASFLNYFKNVEIVCLDVNPFQIKYFSKDIRKIYLDTRSNETLKQVADYFDYEFDIIIDDGSHNKKDQILTINKFLPKLKNKGIYVIEDTCEYLTHPQLNEDKLEYGINEYLASIHKTGKHYSSYLDDNERKNIKNQINKIFFEKGNFIYNGESLFEIIFIEKV